MYVHHSALILFNTEIMIKINTEFDYLLVLCRIDALLLTACSSAIILVFETKMIVLLLTGPCETMQ